MVPHLYYMQLFSRVWPATRNIYATSGRSMTVVRYLWRSMSARKALKRTESAISAQYVLHFLPNVRCAMTSGRLTAISAMWSYFYSTCRSYFPFKTTRKLTIMSSSCEIIWNCIRLTVCSHAVNLRTNCYWVLVGIWWCTCSHLLQFRNHYR